VPYRVDEKNMIWGAASYSSEISDYEQQLERRFSLPSNEQTWLEEELSRRYRGELLEGLLYLGVGLGIFWAVVWSVGWIVRGFLGIPRGLDRKPQ